MATIVFLDGIDEIKGHRKGIQFDISQAGNIAKKRTCAVNRQTNLRMKVRSLLKATNKYFWNLAPWKWVAWHNWAVNNGIADDWGNAHTQRACAAFFSVELNARLAGDPSYDLPPGNLPLGGVTFTNLVRIDNHTIRATFNPTPAGAANRIFLRQSLPGPGHKNWKAVDGYIAEISDLNPVSPYDFTTHFQHLAGWHGRYWTGTQEDTGRRSTEDLWSL